MAMAKRLINFSAGPCQLPVEVLEEVQRDIVNFKGWGLSVMEMSHRGPHFKKVLAEAKEAAIRFFEVPQSHALCFMAGGATAQFAAEALNLLSKEKPSADYAITGYWSKLALKEAQRFAEACVVTDAKANDFTEIDPIEKWNLNEKAAYLHYCDNETIHGVEFPSCPSIKTHHPQTLLVADLASNIGSKPIPWQDIDLAYAGAQKNIGIAGVTVVTMNREILSRDPASCPMVLNYKKIVEADSCLNTPPSLNIYVTGVTLKHMARQGDLSYWDRQCCAKSGEIYKQCDDSGGFFVAPVSPEFRSRVTVRFSIVANETATVAELGDRRKTENGAGNEKRNIDTPEQTEEDKHLVEAAKQRDKELTKLFLEKAEGEEDMICLNGHRSLGGLRACTFSGISTQNIEKLVHFMQEFQEEYAVI